MRKTISNEELAEIVNQSVSWSQVIKKCGAPIAGGSYQYFQARIKNLGLDTTHFLGQRAHTGFRHTGLSKRLHWSEVLTKKKTSGRERSKRFRRVFTDYCKETNTPIQCVKCGNNGDWMGNTLKLQINHIDGNHSNNVPKNLEWLCPNCHDVVTNFNPSMV